MKSTEMTVQKKDPRFQFLYAIGIIMVVSGHCQDGGITFTFGEWFLYYGFHMALFFFCSGYFFRSSNELQFGQYLRHKVRKLIVPLYLWNVIYGLLVQILHHFGFTIGLPLNFYTLVLGPLEGGDHFGYNAASWFLLPLFAVEILYTLWRRGVHHFFPKAPEWIYFAISAPLSVYSNVLAMQGYNHGLLLTLLHILHFMPFYALGFWFYAELEKKAAKVSNVMWFGVILAVKLYIIIRCGTSPSYSPAYMDNYTEGPVITLLNTLCGILFWMRIADLLTPMLPRLEYMKTLADNTFAIMMHQYLGFMMVKLIFGLISLWTPFFADFDWNAFRSQLDYFYLVKGLSQTCIVYLLAGLIVPIGIQKLVNRVKKHLPSF